MFILLLFLKTHIILQQGLSLPIQEMTSITPIDDTTNDVACVVMEPCANSMWPMCDGMLVTKKEVSRLRCKELLEELIKINTKPAGTYIFYFPGVSDAVASIYWDILISMERWCEIDDYFTNPELRIIVMSIDNHDYVKDAYPDTTVGWHGLLADSGIFRAIARYKKQYDNPQLVSVARMCTALTTPMPKHLYYLKFKFSDDSEQLISYRSGDELLNPVSI